jgi:erythritol transport system permease protein
MIIVSIIAAFVASRTPFGRQVYAIGGNERAAELSGVRVKRVKMFVYMISGFLAAVSGLIIAAQLVASHPASGTSFELNAIAAAVWAAHP